MSVKPRIRIYAGSTHTHNSAAKPYEAATQHTQRVTNWFAPSSGPNTTLLANLATLRNRSRAAQRNNPWVSMAIERSVSSEIGTGIVPRFRAKDREFTEAFRNLFDQFSEQCSTDLQLDFYGLQAQVCRTRRVAGECFIRLRRRPVASGFSIPIQLQVVEPEYVPLDKTEMLPNGNRVIGGIEFNRRGQRVAYYMYPQHPDDHLESLSFNGRFIRVPAADVIHHYNPLRPGQVRGEPDAAQALLRAHTFDAYDDAELMRKQTRAPFTGFLSRDTFAQQDFMYDPFTGQALSSSQQAQDIPELDVAPGMILQGLAGEKLELFPGDDSGRGYADFMRQQLLAIAAGMGIPYELMTGDWSRINDRLYRAMINEFRRGIESIQDHLAVFQVSRTIKDWAIASAVSTGRIRVGIVDYQTSMKDYHKTDWRPQVFRHIHPEQDVNAVVKAIEARLTSRDAEIAKLGYDAEEIDEQIVEGQKRIRDALKLEGFTFRTDTDSLTVTGDEQETNQPSGEDDE